MQLFECLKICWLLRHGAGRIHIFYSHLLEFFLYKNSSDSFFLFELSQQLSRRFCKMKFFRPFFVVPLRQKHATVNAATWFLFIYLLFFWSGCTLGTERVVVLGTGVEKKNQKNFKCPTGLWEMMCDDGESIASLRWDGEHHSATGGVPSAARVLKNNPQRLNFQNVLFACLHTHRKLLNLRSI